MFRPRVELLEDRQVLSNLQAGFAESIVTAGLSNPTAMQFAPDGRLFVTEQQGNLRIAGVAAPVLTLTVNSTGERGLLGLAFDPAFATNQHIYLYYTATSPTIHNRVSRFTLNNNSVVPGSELILLDLETLGATNHNGGALNFGSDGKLYIAVGENAVPANAQSLSNHLGKILRINKDGTIPSDNPDFGPGTNPALGIWALGLRNPFTFGVQPGTGRIFINDVGAASFEEINEGFAGANYGWPNSEGFRQAGQTPTTIGTYHDPLFAYGHGNGPTTGNAIVGAAFYNPATLQFPAAYGGDYFFADLTSRWIRVYDTATGGVSGFATNLPGAPVDLKVGPDGALYYLARSSSGLVGRIDYVGVSTGETLGVYVNGAWYIRNANSPGAPDAGQFGYGFFPAQPVVGDWDGDGVATIGVYDPRTAIWYLRNSNTPGAPNIQPFAYGYGGVIPVVGDWDGDGTDSIGVYDPRTATWYLRNSNGPGAPDYQPFAYGFGVNPVVGDWDGDGDDSIGIYHPGNATWYLRDSVSPGAPDYTPFAYGFAGVTPVVGDWDGDGDTTVGVYHNATATWYLRNGGGPGSPDAGSFAYGFGGVTPVAGNWDGLPLPLLGVGTPAGTLPPPLVSADELHGIRGAALQRLRLAGADLALLERLGALPFVIADLPGALLGQTFADRIVIDRDAAGSGWFVDPTPLDDVEFATGADSLAAARFDLLSAVLHELGHGAGLADLPASDHGDDVMAERLPVGRRRLHLDAFFTR